MSRFAPAIGFVAVVSIAIGACSSAYSFRPGGWPWGPVEAIGSWMSRPVGGLFIIVGALVLTWAWWLLRPQVGGPKPRRRLLVLWSLPLWICPPVMSGDPFLYADAGWIVRSGLSPYLVPLTGAGGPFAGGVDSFWAGHGVAYPPLTLLTNWLGIELGGLHPYWGVIGQRFFAGVGIVLVALFLPHLAAVLGGSRDQAIWLGLLNPYVVIHGIGGAHNDALMAGVVVVALWVASRSGRWNWLVFAPILVGIAMALKQQAGLAVIGVAGLPIVAELGKLPLWPRLLKLAGRTVWATIVAVGTFVAISLISGFGFEWVRWMSNMGRAFSMSPSYLVGDMMSQIVSYFGFDAGWCIPVFTGIGTVLWLGLLVWVVFQFSDRPVAAVAWGSLCVSMATQAVHPWYLVLGLVVVAAVPMAARAQRWLVAVTIGFLFAVMTQYLFWWLPPIALGFGAAVGAVLFRSARATR